MYNFQVTVITIYYGKNYVHTQRKKIERGRNFFKIKVSYSKLSVKKKSVNEFKMYCVV